MYATMLWKLSSLSKYIGRVVSKSSPRVLASSYLHSQDHRVREGAVLVQFPQLPPEWEETYKPGQMYRYQASLPKLPVPPLHLSLRKYIATVEPLLSHEELEKTKAVVKEFGREGGVGEKLQQALLDRARSHDIWFSMQQKFLDSQSPLPILSNVVITSPWQPAGDEDTYIRNAAKYVLAAVKWNQLILSKSIPTDFYRNHPLCMSQYDMYSKCRIPGPSGRDTVRKTPIHNSRHIIVMRNGHFFKLDLLYEAPGGGLAVVPGSYVVEELYRILRTAPNPAKHPVGILTAERRDTWHHARKRLMKDPLNKSNLDVIERAQFVLCLDRGFPSSSPSPHSPFSDPHSPFSYPHSPFSDPHSPFSDPHSPFSDPHSTMLLKRCMHGNGSEFNSVNRWFDSVVQMLVGEDGLCGVNLEHAPADGTITIAAHNFILDIISKLRYDLLGEPSHVDRSALSPAEQLQWNISSESTRDIETAKRNMDSLIRDSHLEVFAFTEFGKNNIKSLQTSPDGFIQNAILLAYYKLHKCPPVHLESGSMRRYRLGRLEIVRPTTNASLAFVKTMGDSDASVEEKANSIVHAIKAHNVYVNDAISGQAMDRHLMTLKSLAAEMGMEPPDIFKDETYLRMHHYSLMTSQVSSPHHNIVACHFADVEDGYGVCYNLQDKQVFFSISSFRHYHDTDSQLYGQALMESLREMHNVMVAAKRLT